MRKPMKKILHPSATLPTDAARTLLIGRLWVHGTGPVLVLVSPRGVLRPGHRASPC